MDFFSKNMRFLRVSRKLKQGDIANFLAVSRTTIANYESGISKPDYNNLTKLVEYFNISYTDLITVDLEHQNVYKNPNTETNKKWAETAERALISDTVKASNLFGSNKDMAILYDKGLDIGSAIEKAMYYYDKNYTETINLLLINLGKVNPYLRDNSDFFEQNKDTINKLKAFCKNFDKSRIELKAAIVKEGRYKD